uniref:PARP-type domain-containing protein n=1 Tax=Panagrolaimus sp. PS1159 TaxID=55785 RepID=A0AC35FQS5_9BILA
MSVANKKDNIGGKLGKDKNGEKSAKKEEVKKDSGEKKKTAKKEDEPAKKKNEFENEPPFGIDYAKTGRSHCKGCEKAIPKGELRISTRAKSYRYNGMMENWYHESCFWEKASTNGITEAKVRGFDTIKSEDQNKIRGKIAEAAKNEPNESAGSGAIKRKSDAKNEEVSQKKSKKPGSDKKE